MNKKFKKLTIILIIFSLITIVSCGEDNLNNLIIKSNIETINSLTIGDFFPFENDISIESNSNYFLSQKVYEDNDHIKIYNIRYKFSLQQKITKIFVKKNKIDHIEIFI